MDAKRKNFQSKLLSDKKYNERMIVTLQRSIENIRATMGAGKDIEFYENRIAQTETSIENYNNAIAITMDKLKIILEGGCDAEILKLEEKANDELSEKEEKALKREKKAQEKEERERKRGQRYDSLEKTEMRKENYLKKDVNREYNRFLEVVDTLPDYISKNLRSMPNNKGYRFRNIIFFGELPPENGPTVVFDKKSNGMYITEYYQDQELTFFKPREGPKELVHKTLLRSNFPRGPATRNIIF